MVPGSVTWTSSWGSAIGASSKGRIPVTGTPRSWNVLDKSQTRPVAGMAMNASRKSMKRTRTTSSRASPLGVDLGLVRYSQHLRTFIHNDAQL